MKKKIIIIGGGFAGISAVKRLAISGLDLELTLLDKRECSDFLPVVPDIIGRAVNPRFLESRIKAELSKRKFNFVLDEVVAVDFESQTVKTVLSSYRYDFLLIASGSQTNFFGRQDLMHKVSVLNSVAHAKSLLGVLRENKFENLVVSGGGYTGVECATNLWLYCKQNKLVKKIYIIERAARILAPLPEWMKKDVEKSLKKMGIEILTNSTVETVEESLVKVSTGQLLEKCLLIWVSGVVTADFIQKLMVNKGTQGRLIVDEYLKINQNCFCAGDSAFFKQKDSVLRMAVQFALAQGDCAAKNIARSIKGENLKKFSPLDLGFILPLANNRSCGQICGFKVKGRLATLLHFSMCIFRLPGIKNKIGLMANLLNFKSAVNKGGKKC